MDFFGLHCLLFIFRPHEIKLVAVLPPTAGGWKIDEVTCRPGKGDGLSALLRRVALAGRLRNLRKGAKFFAD